MGKFKLNTGFGRAWVNHGGGGGTGTTPFTPTPPPSLREFGPRVPDHERRIKICLIWQRVTKWVVTPCVYTQNTRIFQENSILEENHI